MVKVCIDPILVERTTHKSAVTVNAHDVVEVLATFEVEDIPEHVVPYLAAATAEAVLVADVRWRFSADNAPVALLRMISRAAMAAPTATGPHLQRLYEQLTQLGDAGERTVRRLTG